MFVGYRWYASKDIPVCFPFGHGLSYTSFEYGPAKVSKSAIRCSGSFGVDEGSESVVKVSVDIRNSGERDGAEVVQLYLAAPTGDIERPAFELKGFEKLYLKAGKSGKAVLELPRRAFARFDADTHRWVVDPGNWRILVGSSSEDIRSTAEIKVI